MKTGKNNCTVGVDLGGTNTAVGIVDCDGNILARKEFSTVLQPSAEVWADTLCDIIAGLRSDSGAEIKGIGVGAPCANALTGCIEKATDLPWPSPIPVTAMLESRTGLKVTLGNDANVAALGEMAYGAAKGLENFIVLTLGTGVGSGIVCDGKLLTGSRGFAGELGHVTFPFAAGRPCGCGRYGCLQTVASAKGVVLTAQQMLAAEPSGNSVLKDLPFDMLTAKNIDEAARAGDELASKVYEFTGRCLGKAAAEFAAFTDPEAIILFGGVAKAGELLLKPMREAFRESALFLYNEQVKLLVSEFPDADAAILGAAALAV